MPKYRRFEKMLHEREAYLARTLERVERELVEPASKDDEERAAEREGDEVLESLGSASVSELRAVREPPALDALRKVRTALAARCGPLRAEGTPLPARADMLRPQGLHRLAR